MPSAAFDYWASGQGLGNITPRGKSWPEGEGFARLLRDLVGDRRVLEFGCGTGRLASLFDADRYVGVDVCAVALDQARSAHLGRDFRVIGDRGVLPLADVTLAHTVLLHVPDEELDDVVARFSSPRVIVSEILGRSWRRPGNPPVFNREPEDYVKAFAPRYVLTCALAHPYPHYRGTDVTLLEFVAA